jgi:hypothetical protein
MPEPEQTVRIRKAQSGSVSGGYEWPEDGSVIPVPYDLAMRLVAIQDGGFSVVDEPEPEPSAAAAAVTE